VGLTNLEWMFYGCTSLTTINNINLWNVSQINNTRRMFENATNFNDNISGWNTQNLSNASYMFYNATNFNNGGNSGINNWNVTSLSNADYMFGNAVAFQQPINNWEVGLLTSATGFMGGKSTANYPASQLDDIFNSWSSFINFIPQSNVTIDFGNIEWTFAGGLSGSLILIDTPWNWIINSGGPI
jgi:surface protein